MKKLFILLLAGLVVATSAQAHVIDYQLDDQTSGSVFGQYLVLGFQHILPLGVDHILFILCIFFLNTQLRSIIIQASMFTLAHSITLGLAIYGVIQPPANIVEPLIAVSIVFLAFENLFSRHVNPWRIVVVFLFGLVHGMGFAGVLSELGIPRGEFITGLLGFNLGIELGQVVIIFSMYLLVARLFSGKTWYRRGIVVPASIAIALIAGYWTMERIGVIG